jgi:hypothetical protein
MRDSSSKAAIMTYDDVNFSNELFLVKSITKLNSYTSHLVLKLSPPVDLQGKPILKDFVECPIEFKMTLKGRWGK